MRIEPEGNVGIGTAAPGKKLDVAGVTRITEGTANQYALLYEDGLHFTRVSDGAETGLIDYDGANRITINSAGGAGAGATRIDFQVNSGSKMMIDNEGDVGIGTVSPARKLGIQSSAGSTGNTGVLNAATALYIDSTAGGNIEFLADAGEANSHGVMWSDDGAQRGSVRYYHNTDRLVLRAGATDTVHIVGGDVGIGTNNPGQRLEIHSSSSLVNDGRYNMVIFDDTAMDAGVGGGLILGGKYTDAGLQTTLANIWCEKENNTTNNIDGQLHFGTRENGGTLGSDMMIDSSGNVYIGEADGNRDIKKFNAAGTLLFNFNVATESRGSDWIDLAADQTTMYYTSEGYIIKRFDVSTNTQLTDFATLPERPSYALRILSGGGVLVASSQHCYRLDSTGALVQTYAKPVGETSFLFALNLDPDGTSFWTAGYSSGNVYKIDIATGTVMLTINTKLDGPVNTLAGLTVYGEKTALGSISGMKFNDLDGDGILDAGEPGLKGWTIELTDSSGTLVTTTTDTNGNYQFALLADDDYKVSEVNQLGWTQTAPTPGTYSVTIVGGGDETNVDFGNMERPISGIPLFSDILMLLSLGLIAGAMIIQRRRKANN